MSFIKPKYIILIAIVFAFGCNNQSKVRKMLTRKWQVEEFDNVGLTRHIDSLKHIMDTTKDSVAIFRINYEMKMQKAFIETIKTMTVEYRPDGVMEKVVMLKGQPESQQRNWLLLADGKTIIVTDQKQEMDTIYIGEISESKLSTISVDKATTITYKAL